jgi:hypothetical protein
MKIIRRLCQFILPVYFLISCNRDQKLTEIIELSHYPSASGIEYFNKQFYIIGDDATQLLVLDSNLTIKDSVLLFDYPSTRIPKEIKPDIESISILRNDENVFQLFLTGSGSAPPRNKGWFINTKTSQADTVLLDTIYQRLKLNGLDEINIEGACSLPGTIILANRGHKAWPKNHLIFLRNDFWKNQLQTPVTVIRMGVNTDTAEFHGISGLFYSRRSDKLILTVSTEDTRSSYEDGVIGKSYLWIVEHITSKRGWKGINPNKIIDLEKVDHRFKGHKIESACIEKEDNNFMHLVLVSDNDNGSSTLFRMILKK